VSPKKTIILDPTHYTYFVSDRVNTAKRLEGNYYPSDKGPRPVAYCIPWSAEAEREAAEILETMRQTDLKCQEALFNYWTELTKIRYRREAEEAEK
jgi:hypothetical protein